MMQEHGVNGFHELRAAYACDRYQQLTDHSAPVNGGQCYRIDRRLDRRAREQISLELGHNRSSTTRYYYKLTALLIWRRLENDLKPDLIKIIP